MAAIAEAPPVDLRATKGESLWRIRGRIFIRQRSAIIGVVLVVILALIAIFAPVIATHDPEQVLIGIEEGVKKREPPCIHALGCPETQPQHFMGTDGNLRDEFSRVIYGTRVSLLVGFVTVSVALVLGVILGGVAGYAGHWSDDGIMRFLDVLLAFPSLLLAIAIVTVLGPGLTNAMLAIAIVTIPAYARVMRSVVLSAKEQEYVTAARVLGVRSSNILFRHILPNAISPLLVLATLGVGTAILDAAALSFLGLGAQPPSAEWGSMLASERNQVFSAPHLVFFPGLFITITVLGFNLLGDGLRDTLDPRMKNR